MPKRPETSRRRPQTRHLNLVRQDRSPAVTEGPATTPPAPASAADHPGTDDSETGIVLAW